MAPAFKTIRFQALQFMCSIQYLLVSSRLDPSEIMSELFEATCLEQAWEPMNENMTWNSLLHSK
jgi:hypothetical protein